MVLVILIRKCRLWTSSPLQSLTPRTLGKDRRKRLLKRSAKVLPCHPLTACPTSPASLNRSHLAPRCMKLRSTLSSQSYSIGTEIKTVHVLELSRPSKLAVPDNATSNIDSVFPQLLGLIGHGRAFWIATLDTILKFPLTTPVELRGALSTQHTTCQSSFQNGSSDLNI